MEQFKNVEPAIKANKLENRIADKFQREEKKAVKAQDPKHYIKKNMRAVYKLDDQVKQQKENLQLVEEFNKTKSELRKGVMPKYLVKRKEEEANENKRIIREVELNKRPQGTQRLTQEEIQNMRERLQIERDSLQQQVVKMSVSLYTTRARQQYKDICDKLEEIDRAITVFERDNVYIKKD